MKKLQKYVHVLPIIGKVDDRQKNEIVSLKLDLVEMAYLNKVKFFDVYTSLLRKLENSGETIMNYFLENGNGPCPPYSVITFKDAVFGESSTGKKVLKYGRKFPYGQ